MKRFAIRYRFCYINENGKCSSWAFDNVMECEAESKEQAKQKVKEWVERLGTRKVVQIDF